TIGRVPSFASSSPQEPSLTTQLTHAQGPLARNIEDLRLGLHTLAVRDPRDPWWVPAPFDQSSQRQPLRVALCMPPTSARADAAAEMDFQGYVQAFARRASMLREWQLFSERLPLLLIPISYRLPLPIDFDQGGDQPVKEMLHAHEPMLAISSLGLPGLAVPTG